MSHFPALHRLSSSLSKTFLLWTWIILILIPMAFLWADDVTAPTTPPGADVISIDFDQQPTEKGLTFDRTGAEATTVQFQGQSYDAWNATKSTEPGRDWSRTFRFKVTDPGFQSGAHPVVDIEVTYNLPAGGELDLKADTVDGPKELGKSYTSANQAGNWQVITFPLNNAYFGSRTDPKDVVPKLNGYDLRLDAHNAPFLIRRVRLIGYDLDKNVNWNRVLAAAQPTASTPGGIFVFPKAPNQQLTAVMQNFSRVGGQLYYRIQIANYDDKIVFQKEGDLKVPATGTLPLKISLNTSTWLLGPYDGKLDLYLDQAETHPLVSRTFRMGVVTSTTLEKARDGEFLYGVDPANNDIFPTHTPNAFAFYRTMGVDILRSPYEKESPRTTASLQANLEDLGKEGVQSLCGWDPPKDEDPVKRQAHLDKITALLEDMEKTCEGRGPGKSHYWELGNEPDLFSFNPRSIPEFTQAYEAMYDALKKGCQDAGGKPDDVKVMNGGLSFAGAIGIARSHEFLGTVKNDKLDIIAYHGHGPGIQAERMAYERVKAAAAQCGKTGNWTFVETESGVSASNRPGMVDQARTAVEKMTYAQSVNEPFFIFFRLFMEGTGIEGGYGLTDNLLEPRPSVMSYRNMVERLRHFRYVKSLDYATEIGAKDTHAFLFEEMDAQHQPTGRKTLVAFGEDPVQYELRLQLDEKGSKVTSPIIYDMYGNPTPAIPTSNVATLQVGLDPVYLCWSSPGSTNAVKISPPVLSVNASEPILIGASTSIPLIVRNPGDLPIDAVLETAAQARVSAQADPASQKLSLPPNQPMPASVAIHLDPANQPLELPLWWKVFPDVDYTKLTPQQLTTFPDKLPGTKGAVAGQYVWAENNHIDIAKVAGGLTTKRPGIVYAIFDSPEDVSLNCGASSDWWMAWYLNGEKVYDDMDKGNLEKSLAVHSFTLPLKKGRNVLAVAVLSGTFGWALDFGGPKELQISQTGSASPESLSFTLKSGDKVLTSQKVPFELQTPVPSLGQMSSPDQPAEWMPLEPLAVLEDQAVKNYWMKEPDSSRWYKGPKDLSGIVWLRDDGKNLQLFAAIADDKLVQAQTPADLPKNDSMRVVIVDDTGKPLLDTTAGLVNNAPALIGTTANLVFNASRNEDPVNPTTYYHLTIPRTVVGSQPFRISVAVADNDSNFLKQIMNLGNSENPAQGKREVLAP